MSHKSKIPLLTVFVICCGAILANDERIDAELPPIETIILEPIELENISIWVPAAKTGPVINRSCQPKKCSYSPMLAATVNHTRDDDCPEEVARLLAEYTAVYHEKSLPLTMFNGWQWEFSYSLCQFESVTYNLPSRGGCWESSWDAILTLSAGSADFKWVDILPSGNFLYKQLGDVQKSNIEVRTFSSMRIRDGYPKERKL